MNKLSVLEGVGKCWNAVGRCWTVGRLDEKFTLGKMIFAFFFKGVKNENIFMNGNGGCMVSCGNRKHTLSATDKANRKQEL
jgi:hypothetical protein